jgi:hypothetical protein
VEQNNVSPSDFFSSLVTFRVPKLIVQYDDPYHPLLAISSDEDSRLESAKTDSSTQPKVEDPNVSATINPDDLPHCPKCKTGLLRPGVVCKYDPLHLSPENPPSLLKLPIKFQNAVGILEMEKHAFLLGNLY